MFLDLAYFRKQYANGVPSETLASALLAIQLSRYYPKSPGNEANYETFRRNLEQLSIEFSELEVIAQRAGELLSIDHLPNASAETLVDFCIAEQEKEDLPLRKIYENTPFQLSRGDEISEAYERKVFRRAMATETCARWFSLDRKLDRLFGNEEILTALRDISDPMIRKGLLRSLVRRGLVDEVLEIVWRADKSEQKEVFWALARENSLRSSRLGEEEARFWLFMLEREPYDVFSGGAERVVKDSEEFAFLLAPLRTYFFKHVSEHSEEFLLDGEPVLPINLLRMLIALEPAFDEETWMAAARYRGYRIIEIDYRNGFKFGNRTAKNFPVSAFALSHIREQGIQLPSDVPVSVEEPYRDPRDR